MPPKGSKKIQLYGKFYKDYIDGCQNYGPFLGTLNIRCRILIGNPKGTIILTTTHIGVIMGLYRGSNF